MLCFISTFSLWPLSASILTAGVRAQEEKEKICALKTANLRPSRSYFSPPVV